MKQQLKSRAAVVASVAAVVGLVLAPVAASAATANTTINAVLASSISVTTSGTVTLNIIPVSGGAQSTASDTVTVTTNHGTGYNLSLKDADANTNLVNGGNNIPTSSSTTWGSPATLSNNTWGYGIASGTANLTAGSNFSASYTAQTDQTTDSHLFLGVKTTDQLLRTTSAAAGSGEVTTVWYSAKADTTNPTGTYTDTVTYTALTN
ncbi:hypothetical protein KA093_02435 [Candidatus Saccharibacteria bacterium]|nr:hypothetical protein [Candidatus Saccharibacteria bacterium]